MPCPPAAILRCDHLYMPTFLDGCRTHRQAARSRVIVLSPDHIPTGEP